MNISVREVNMLNILSIEGNVDINSSEIIETVGWLLKHNRLNMICNIEKVEMVDYSGLSILAIAYKNVINHKGHMVFCCVPLHIYQLFSVVKLDMVFQMYETEEAALRCFDETSAVQQMRMRRRFKRLDMHLDAQFYVAQGHGEQKPVYRGRVLNLSGDGVFVYAKKALPIGTRVMVELSLEEKRSPLAVSGMVIWRTDKALQPQLYPGMGIRFLDIDTYVQSCILKYIDRNLTTRSRML